MISIDPFSRDGYDNDCIWLGGCIGFFGLLLGGLIVHCTKEANLFLWSKSFKFKKF